MNTDNLRPVDIGLDALGAEVEEDLIVLLGLPNCDYDIAQTRLCERMETAMGQYPELKPEIFMASVSVLLRFAKNIGDVKNLLTNEFTNVVDRVAT